MKFKKDIVHLGMFGVNCLKSENKSSMDELGSSKQFEGMRGRMSHNCFKPEKKLNI